jgi:hypothetical protein
MDPQIAETIQKVVTALGTLMVAATAIVAFFKGPKAEKTRGVFDTILAFLRMIGFGTFKDEPGTASMPLKPDSGERVTSTTNVKK